MGWDELIAAMGKCRALLGAGKVCSAKAVITLTLAAGLTIPITADLSFAPAQQPVISGGTVTGTTTVGNPSSPGTPPLVIQTVSLPNATLANPAPIGFVQGASINVASPGAGTSATSFNANVASGDAITIHMVGRNAGVTVSSVADTLGNTFVKDIATTDSSNLDREIWHVCRSAAGGGDTVTATWSASQGGFLEIHEYAGIIANPCVDGSAVGATGTSTALDSGALTTTNANDLLFAGGRMAPPVSLSAGANFTQRDNVANAVMTEDQIVGATGAYHGTFTGASSSTWVANLVALEGANSAASAYSQQVAATGGTAPYSWTVQSGALMAGTSLSPGGLLSGNLTATGTFNFTLKVTDSAGTPNTQTQAYVVVVAPAGLQITTTSIPNGTVSVAYPSTTFQAAGGTAPYTWSVVQGALPGGLTLSSAGVLSGTPSGSGTFTFLVQVQDAKGLTATRNFNNVVVVQPVAAPAVSSVSPTSGNVGSSVTVNGANFTNDAVVAFASAGNGSVNAATSFVGATQLTATVPNLPLALYDVKVTQASGTNTLPQGFTVTAVTSSCGQGGASLLAGCTPANIGGHVPAGWTLAGTEDFEGGVLHLNGALPTGASITQNNPHGGNWSVQGSYTTNGSATGLYVNNAQLGSGTEFYVSWYDFKELQGRMNDEMFLMRPFINNSNGTLLQEVIVDYFGYGSPTNSGFNSTLGTLIIEPQGAYYGNLGGIGRAIQWGSWEQTEVHFKANSPGNSDGSIEVFINGKAVYQNLAAKMNGTVNMSGMSILIEGTYTKATWVHADGSCGTFIGDGQDNGPQVSNFNNVCPCANECPPNPPGKVPVFKRYLDDIVILTK